MVLQGHRAHDKLPACQDHRMALGMVLLLGPTGLFLMSEVHLFCRVQRGGGFLGNPVEIGDVHCTRCVFLIAQRRGKAPLTNLFHRMY
jgi:hypothetical protein